MSSRFTLKICALLASGTMLAACASPTDDVEGTWTEGASELSFSSDGALSGTDGCNRLSGSWEKDSNTISFNQVAMTQMACVDIDQWLGALHTAHVAGDAMNIHDQAGNTIGTLKRVN